MLDFTEKKNGDGSLTSRVYAALEKGILDGVYPDGSSLTENKLSSELNVSRTPVREALFRLEQEGLVRIVHNKGAVVTGVSLADIRDIYTIRMQIEGLASRWAAERASDQQIKRMHEIVDLEMFYASKTDIGQTRNLDSLFHSELYEASGSNPLRRTLSTYHSYIGRARERSFARGDRPVLAAKEHMGILDAIISKDGDLAEKLTREHISNALSNLLKSIDEGSAERTK
ncbi:MAG: GntR family transcriptional regulator [Ruminococcaceae bacterium]|nr:GntR family transcriptional regulator [Oscillospiraceae bacterium]MBQ8898047.1 GntR family transcriptional regulator [Clostridia bacterium]